MLLQVNNLSKEFKLPNNSLFEKAEVFQAVKDVTFSIKEGKTFGLVGESGSGKSTISKMIAGLLRPTSGEILFEGRSILEPSGNNSRNVDKEIQMVFQDPFNALNPSKTIGWIVEEPLKVHGLAGKTERQRRVRELLAEVGLDESILKRYPKQLSGGQRQRVVIMTAIILKPKLVILDEAVSALDVSVQAQILNLLKDLQKKFNLSYLFISHDLNVVEYMADAIGVLRRGEIVELASARELTHQPVHPYTRALLEAVPSFEKEDAFHQQKQMYEQVCYQKTGIVNYNESHFVRCDSETFSG